MPARNPVPLDFANIPKHARYMKKLLIIISNRGIIIRPYEIRLLARYIAIT
jgi:hypothetical protein